MLNLFYFDRINDHLKTVECAFEKLVLAEVKDAVRSLAEIRSYVAAVRDLSKHTDHLWHEADSLNFPNGWFPPPNPDVTYLDQFAARYELARRRLKGEQ